MQEEMNRVRIRINSEELHIKRVPIETKRKFMELAETDFCGDYGMLLKALVDGLIDKDMNIVLNALEQLERRVMFIESTIIAKKDNNVNNKVIKTLDGRELRIEGGKENVKT